MLSACLISVQFNSRWYLCARKSPYALHPVSQMFPQRCLRNSDWRWPSLVISKKIVQSFLCPRLCPPCDRWCDVLGFVPAGSVSNCSTLQIFRDASHLWGLLCPPVYLLGHFGSLRHIQGSTCTHRIFRRWRSTIGTFQSGLPDRRFIFCSKFIESVRRRTCVVWLSPLEAINPAGSWVTACFLFHCQAGGWDGIGRTVRHHLQSTSLSHRSCHTSMYAWLGFVVVVVVVVDDFVCFGFVLFCFCFVLFLFCFVFVFVAEPDRKCKLNRKIKFLVCLVSEEGKVIFWPSPGLKERTVYRSCFSLWMLWVEFLGVREGKVPKPVILKSSRLWTNSLSFVSLHVSLDR